MSSSTDIQNISGETQYVDPFGEWPDGETRSFDANYAAGQGHESVQAIVDHFLDTQNANLTRARFALAKDAKRITAAADKAAQKTVKDGDNSTSPTPAQTAGAN